ncbi:hypothetical protein ACPC37_34770 [Streptomyces griseoincarnatus]|uniref:hypothetical protein n=1 Tax=Paenibacillus glucanolyticus TaxID=59843 RepID=UPI00367C4F89
MDQTREQLNNLIDRLERNALSPQEFIDELVPAVSKMVAYLQEKQLAFDKRMDAVDQKVDRLVEDLQTADIVNGIAREFMESRGLITEFDLYMNRTLETIMLQIKTIH